MMQDSRGILPIARLIRARVAIRGAALVCAAVLLTACGRQVDVFSTGTEGEANEVLSALLDADIRANKVTEKSGVSVTVRDADVGKALDLLRAQGLPRERFDGLGKTFRKEGLISSPLEERARYIYALSQELADTLSRMDGVVAARVHVVLPEVGNSGDATTRSTAGIFIKHQPGYNLQVLAPQIRELVTHAIPALADDRVSIAFVPARPVPTPASVAAAAAENQPQSAGLPLWSWLVVAVSAIVVLVMAVIVARTQKQSRQDGQFADTDPADPNSRDAQESA
jgi:type III secretion protein J